MKYNFSKRTLSNLPRYCMDCGRTDAPLETHHIKGRKNGLHISSFNAIRLCKQCHSDAVQNDDCSARLFRKTYDYLYRKKYKPNKLDYDFISHYIRIFKNFL